MIDSFAIIYMLGAVQGVFLATILMSRRRGSVANRILAITMLAFSLDLAVAVYHATGYDRLFPHFIGADFPLAFLYGPLLYLYARALSNRERIFDRRYLWHFLPFALLVLFLVPFYLQSGGEKMAFVRAPGSGLWAQALGTINHFKLVHALVYVGMILSLLKRHRYRIQDRFSSIERINLNWLRDLMIGIVVLMVVSIALYILSLGGQRIVIGLDPSTINDDYMLLGLACLVYGVGLMGLRQPEIFDGRRHSRDMPVVTSQGTPTIETFQRRAGPAIQQSELSIIQHSERSIIHQPEDAIDHQPEDAAIQPIDRRANQPSDGRGVQAPGGRHARLVGRSSSRAAPGERPYARSGMNQATAKRYQGRLTDAMQSDKLYRRGDLTLQDLSDALAISPHNLTEVINMQLGQNFYDFVNSYRVREVQDRLADPEFAHLTVLAVALESGFNSKSAFNAVFKKHTKMTPSQFRSIVRQAPPSQR